eukprot:CAMPEP_0198280184 /NCGR_PEP_ID=MMETSP1449-20131203/316_1 /TAXON_ID=420275 /ORGANISM="Attheya septentrionalis, Strain CCMP2084" /LENGTH=469 /DNA_ID=CAMNT_0043975473 /DNA_START=130 /DNA_END=1539 /DNA_ORIENTATION=+
MTECQYKTHPVVPIVARRRNARCSRRMSLLPPSCYVLIFLILSIFLECGSSEHLRNFDVTDDASSRGNRGSSEIDDSSIGVSLKFPPLDDTLELCRLSGVVYSFLHQDAMGCNATNSAGDSLLPPDLTCLLYEHDRDGAQVLLVSSHQKKYVAVVFAGTDNVRTCLTDTDILTKPFGAASDNDNHTDHGLLPPGSRVRVHAGFNNQVFSHGLFDRILDLVQTTKRNNPHYRILTAGHSLGAADSILTAVALKHYFSSDYILSINFGSPRTGNWYWKDYVNQIDHLGIWRFVHERDIVPRLPVMPFHHVGHTVQLNKHSAKAYYLHEGDESLGFAGVPFGWSSRSYIWPPGAIMDHNIHHYYIYLLTAVKEPETYYASEFVTRKDHNQTIITDDDDDDDDDDDTYVDPPDDVYPGDEEWETPFDHATMSEDFMIDAEISSLHIMEQLMEAYEEDSTNLESSIWNRPTATT